MRPSLHFASFRPGPGLKCAWVLGFLVCAGSMSLLRSQDLPSAASPQSAYATLPDRPSSTVPSPVLAPAPKFEAVAPDTGQAQVQLQGSYVANPPQWSRSMLEPFEPGPGFGIFSSAASGFGARRPGPGSLNQFGASAMSVGQDNRAYSFLLRVGPAHGPSAMAMGTYDASPGTAPSFSQLMRGSLTMPLNTSAGAFRLSYNDRFGRRDNGAGLDFNRIIATGTYTSPDLGNGMHLSAGSNYNGHYLPGTPAQMKHNGPSVAIKLQF